ncbi:arabidopsis phospholipase-like protein [Striga asiatica]|uniref:Arabidopsis phospholipase-like protein n=1 Tax=Striga asiatica TaxID=4170 RepID=A0A5A7PSV3_STRAF|nr:arabidopsis phospholipase-like protein [Striga asiatica]
MNTSELVSPSTDFISLSFSTTALLRVAFRISIESTDAWQQQQPESRQMVNPHQSLYQWWAPPVEPLAKGSPQRRPNSPADQSTRRSMSSRGGISLPVPGKAEA